MSLLYLDRHLCLLAIGRGYSDDCLALLDCRYNAVGVNRGNGGVGRSPVQRRDRLRRGQLHLRAQVLRGANLHCLFRLGQLDLRRAGVHGDLHRLPNAVSGQNVDHAAARTDRLDLALSGNGGHGGITGDVLQLSNVILQLALLDALYGGLDALRLAQLDRQRRCLQRQAARIGDFLRAIAGVSVDSRAIAQDILLAAVLHHPGAYISLIAAALGKAGDGIAGSISTFDGCNQRIVALAIAPLEEDVVTVHVVSACPGQLQGSISLRYHRGDQQAAGFRSWRRCRRRCGRRRRCRRRRRFSLVHIDQRIGGEQVAFAGDAVARARGDDLGHAVVDAHDVGWLRAPGLLL